MFRLAKGFVSAFLPALLPWRSTAAVARSIELQRSRNASDGCRRLPSQRLGESRRPPSPLSLMSMRVSARPSLAPGGARSRWRCAELFGHQSAAVGQHRPTNGRITGTPGPDGPGCVRTHHHYGGRCRRARPPFRDRAVLHHRDRRPSAWAWPRCAGKRRRPRWMARRSMISPAIASSTAAAARISISSVLIDDPATTTYEFTELSDRHLVLRRGRRECRRARGPAHHHLHEVHLTRRRQCYPRGHS